MNVVVMQGYIIHGKVAANGCVVACGIGLGHYAGETCIEDFYVVNFEVGAEPVEFHSHLTALDTNAVDAFGFTASNAEVLAVFCADGVPAICCNDMCSTAAVPYDNGIVRTAYNIFEYNASIFYLAAQANDVARLKTESLAVDNFDARGHYISTTFTSYRNSVSRCSSVAGNVKTVGGNRSDVGG